MKKIIYYVAVTLLAAVLAVVSLAQGGTQKTAEKDLGLFTAAVAQSAEKSVEDITALSAADDVFEYIRAEINSISGASFHASTQHYGYDDQIRYFGNSSQIFIDYELTNIIVTVNYSSAPQNDVLLVTTHYDRAAGSRGAYDSALNIALMIESIKLLASGTLAATNPVAFLFTDGYHNANTGLRKFLDLSDLSKRNPLDTDNYSFERDILSRAKLIVNLENFGTSGALTLYGTSSADYNLVDLYIKGGGKAAQGGSALQNIYSLRASKNDSVSLLVKSGANVLGFGTFGDAHKINTALDAYDAETFNKDLLTASGVNLLSVLKTFGSRSLDLKTKGRAPDATYFGYLGLTVNISFFGVFMLLVVTLLIFAAALILNFKRGRGTGRYDYYQLLLAAGADCAFILAGLAVAFLLQIFLGLFGAAGAILRSSFYSGGALLAGVILFALAGILASRFVYEKYLKSKVAIGDKELAAAPSFIFILLSLVFAVAFPAAGYVFGIPALVCAINLLIKNIFKNNFLDSLNLDLIAVALALPVAIPFTVGLYTVLGAVSAAEAIPLFGLLFLFVLSHAAKIGQPKKKSAETAEAIETSDTQPADESETEQATPPAGVAETAKPTAASAEPPVRVKKPFKFNSLVAACMAGVLGFALILSGGLDTGARNQFGAAITKNNLSAFDRAAYANSVVYTYGQKIEDGEQTSTNFSYSIYGRETYHALKKHTDMFKYGSAFSTARAVNISPAAVPAIRVTGNAPTWKWYEPEEGEEPAQTAASDTDGDPAEPVRIYTSIVYSINIEPVNEETLFELTVQNADKKLSSIIYSDGQSTTQIDKNKFGTHSTVKLYLGKKCTVSLLFNELNLSDETKIPRLTVTYREIAFGAAVPSALSWISQVDGLGFNIVYKYDIALKPQKISE